MRFFLTLLLALLASQAISSPALPPGSLRVRHLNATANMSMEHVWSIVQDKQGYVWMAGDSGLHRFDGHRIKSFKASPGTPGGLAHNSVRRLFVDPGGTLWLGTRGGVQHYDPVSETFVLHRQEGAAPNAKNISVRVFAADGKGGLWAGTSDGLVHFDPRQDKFTLTALADGQQQQRSIAILDIAVDQQGRPWVARPNDILRFDPQTGEVRRFGLTRCHVPALSKDATLARRLLLDGDRLWVATTSGLERWDLSKDDAPCTDLGPAARLAGLHVVTMLKDLDNDIWMGVDGAGLVRWRRGDGGLDWFEYKDGDPYGIGDKLIQTLAQDRSGTLWVGTLTAGVGYVDLASGGFRRLVNTKAAQDNLSSNLITEMGKLRDGRLWIATLDAGVNLYDQATGALENLQPLPRETIARLNNGGVFGLAQDSSDGIWVTSELGLHRYDKHRKQFQGAQLLADAAHGTYVLNLHSDAEGMLWGTSQDGVRRFDPRSGKITAFKHDPKVSDSVSSNKIARIMRDRRGEEWVVTHAGIDLLDPATGRARRLRHPRFADGVSCLYEDRRGDVWVCLATGLLKVHLMGEGQEIIFHPISAKVVSVLEADDGRLWLGTERGIAAYDPHTKKIALYTSGDGVADGTFRDGSALRDEDGTMYFGSFRGGVTIFDPAAVRDNAIPPQVGITALLVDNRLLEPLKPPQGIELSASLADRKLTLSHHQSTLAIEFSAMHFADPERNTYAYRLEGLDDEWRTTDAAKPFALYGSLAPGAYRFQVKAANKHGVWSLEPASLRIEVMPAIWATWWFRTIAGLLLALLLWVAYRFRVRLLIRKQVQLEAVVEERTNEVRNTLRQLTAAQEELVLRGKMASVGTLTAGIAHEINNPANFAHVGAQLLENDLQEFHQLLRELAGEEAEAEVMRAIEERFNALYERIGTIATGTTRICELVKDLRTFARLDEAAKKEADLIQGLQSTIQLVRPQYEHVVEFVTDFALRPTLECWPAQLNQVFMNVIVNACQAIEARQHQEQGAPPGRLTISSREENACCVLDFEDNGCGIPKDIVDRIFEPFFTTKEVGAGTGLGLSISFAIVVRHNGTISTRSVVGQGSCFTIRLPMISSV